MTSKAASCSNMLPSRSLFHECCGATPAQMLAKQCAHSRGGCAQTAGCMAHDVVTHGSHM